MTKLVEALKMGVREEKEVVYRPQYREERKRVLERLCEEGYIAGWQVMGGEKKGRRVERRRVSVGAGSVGSMRHRKRGSKGSRETYRKRNDRWGRHGEKAQVRVSTPRGPQRNKGRRRHRHGGKRRFHVQ